jgi:hypothetical protein
MSNICKCHYQLTYFVWRKKNFPWEGNLLSWGMPHFPFMSALAYFNVQHTSHAPVSHFTLHTSHAPRSTTTTHVSMLFLRRSDRLREYKWAIDRLREYKWAIDRLREYKWAMDRLRECKWAIQRRTIIENLRHCTHYFTGRTTVYFDIKSSAGLQIFRRICIENAKFLLPAPCHVRLSARIQPHPLVKFDIGEVLQNISQETPNIVKIRQYRTLYIDTYVC